MHLVEEHIFEMAQEGATLTNEERLHLNQCEDCGRLFRMFVLHRYYARKRNLRSEETVELLPIL